MEKKYYKTLVKVSIIFPGDYKTDDGRILVSDLDGVDVGQDGYLADLETGELLEVLRNPETEEVVGVYEYLSA